MSTCNRLDLETRGYRLVMLKILPGHRAILQPKVFTTSEIYFEFSRGASTIIIGAMNPHMEDYTHFHLMFAYIYLMSGYLSMKQA
jgi:hypothetical protein